MSRLGVLSNQWARLQELEQLFAVQAAAPTEPSPSLADQVRGWAFIADPASGVASGVASGLSLCPTVGLKLSDLERADEEHSTTALLALASALERGRLDVGDRALLTRLNQLFRHDLGQAQRELLGR